MLGHVAAAASYTLTCRCEMNINTFVRHARHVVFTRIPCETSVSGAVVIKTDFK